MEARLVIFRVPEIMDKQVVHRLQDTFWLKNSARGNHGRGMAGNFLWQLQW
jgi:hypothetical protein